MTVATSSNPSDHELANWRELFVISFLSLVLELAAVRWLASYAVYIGFFTNLILIASFLGLSLGILASQRKFRLMHLTPAALAAATTAGIGLHWGFMRLPIGVRLGDPRDPSMVYFGAEYRALSPRFSSVPIELVAGLFFVLSLVVFLGVGQELGRRLEASRRPLDAYLVNLTGSVLGVGFFTLASSLHLSPVWWYALPMLGLGWFLPGRGAVRLGHALLLLAAAGLSGAVGLGIGFSRADIAWSPYYQIRHDRDTAVIYVNGLAHQQMHAVEDQGIVYRLPFELLASADHAIGDALVIGAGSGNDVAQLLRAGATRIDAVEIDPEIAALGDRLHPAQPYADPRVHRTIADGRDFLHRTERRYDTIVYALVDSLASHSSYASVRLESYLMTREAMVDIRERLAPGGVAVIYNSFRRGFVVTRLVAMLEDAFGAPPITITIPFRAHVAAGDQDSGFALLLAGDVDDLRERFATLGPVCLGPVSSGPVSFADAGGGSRLAAGAACPPSAAIVPATVEAANDDLIPTDDWPFLYLRDRSIPGHVLTLNAAITVVTLLLLSWLAPTGALGRPCVHFLFLGAGFMLLETRSVVQLALLYGATWRTTAVVILAILLTATVATWLVRRFDVQRRGPAYAALGLTLLISQMIPATSLLDTGEPLRTLLVLALVGAPIFCASVVFAVSFARSDQPATDFGWNIAGVVLGAVAENASLLIGFKSLLLVAMAVYALSALSLLVVRPKAA